jgi:hypothetical protein
MHSITESTAFQQAIAVERVRLWILVRRDITALCHLVDESQQLMDDARPELHSRTIGTAVAQLPPTEQDASS